MIRIECFRGFLLVLFLVVSVSSQENWKKVENDFFSFSVPESFGKTKIRGIDSFVEEYVNKEIKVRFDYGVYSNNFQGWPEDTKFDYLTVDGRYARIGTSKEEFHEGFPYSTKIYIRLGKNTALSMFAACKSEKEVAVARKIFESIVFNK